MWFQVPLATSRSSSRQAVSMKAWAFSKVTKGETQPAVRAETGGGKTSAAIRLFIEIFFPHQIVHQGLEAGGISAIQCELEIEAEVHSAFLENMDEFLAFFAPRDFTGSREKL